MQEPAAHVTLGARPPFEAEALLAFLAARAVPGVEHAGPGRYVRTLRLPHGHGVADVTPAAAGAGLDIVLRLEDGRDRAAAEHRLRHLFDLDADPEVVDEHLAADPVLSPLVAAHPGRRMPGSADPFETAVKAIVGQQISVSGARTIAGRIAAGAGEPLRLADERLDVVFPEPGVLAVAPDAVFSMPARRRDTIRSVAAAIAAGGLRLERGVDRDEVRARLLALPGIGPWTADYVRMRALGDPDVFLPTDLGVVRGLAALGLTPERAERWRPWRSYALHHLWSVG